MGGILILLLLTVPQMHFSSFEDAWKTAKSVEIVDNGILFGWNVWRTLENGTPIAAAVFTGACAERAQECHSSGDAEYLENGLLVIAGSMALLGVFGRRGTVAAQDPFHVNGRNEPAGWISGAV